MPEKKNFFKIIYKIEEASKIEIKKVSPKLIASPYSENQESQSKVV